jgi:hypothetical protein
MLGYVSSSQRGQADVVLGRVADALRIEGWPLAGVVQVNDEYDPARPCHMDLHVLQGGDVIRISQDLGALSRGCRLDPAGLEAAVGLVEQAVAQGPRLLILNKFGKQEADGRGFRPVIGSALAAGIPVLLGVGPAQMAAFDDFADGMGEPLPLDFTALLRWCRIQARDQLSAS